MSSVSVTDPLCHDSDDGEIIIDVQGGILPYSSVYGTLIPSNIISNSIVYSNLSSNSDTLFVYDSNNCQNYDFNPRTISDAFERETTRYLLADLSTYNNAVVNLIKRTVKAHSAL